MIIDGLAKLVFCNPPPRPRYKHLFLPFQASLRSQAQASIERLESASYISPETRLPISSIGRTQLTNWTTDLACESKQGLTQPQPSCAAIRRRKWLLPKRIILINNQQNRQIAGAWIPAAQPMTCSKCTRTAISMIERRCEWELWLGLEPVCAISCKICITFTSISVNWN